MGRLLGSLKDFPAPSSAAWRSARRSTRPACAPEHVEYVIMGQVLTAGAGQIPARQAAAGAGIPMTVPALTDQQGLPLRASTPIALADQLIRPGEFDVVVAGGQESMTQAPHLLAGSRAGFKYGDVTMRDHMAYDGLWDAFTDQAMGALTEAANDADRHFSRAEQDAFSARSHQRAAQGWKNGLFDDEVVPVSDPAAQGRPAGCSSTDEGIRARHHGRVAGRLRPAFRRDGTITAGSASQISDGAAAVVVISRGEGRGARV